MSRLSVRADALHVDDEWDDVDDGIAVRVRCIESPVPAATRGLVRVAARFLVGDRERTRGRLLYDADEMLDIERPDPPTDEEHEAALRERLRTFEVCAADSRPVAAVLRLLDAERAKVGAVATALRQHDEGLTGQASALSYVRAVLGAKP